MEGKAGEGKRGRVKEGEGKGEREGFSLPYLLCGG